MSDDLTERAVRMLLGGATLLGQPCPYCAGVRVIKDGNALCTSCGREPRRPRTDPAPPEGGTALANMEKKLELLTEELGLETDHEKQRQIIRSIDLLADTIKKMRGRP